MTLSSFSGVRKTLSRGGKHGARGFWYPDSALPAMLIACVVFRKYSNSAHRDSPLVFHPPRATATSRPAPIKRSKYRHRIKL